MTSVPESGMNFHHAQRLETNSLPPVCSLCQM